MADQTSVAVRTLPLALALLLVLLPQGAAAATGSRIIVKRDAGLSAAERADIRADADVRFVESLPLPRTELVAAAPGDVRDALRDLNRDPDVTYAELDRPIRAFADPNDPYFDLLWGLENRGDLFASSVADADMDILGAWGLSTGAGRTVAVVDTGVDATHPDLAANMTPGWDFVGNDPYPTDADGHGTHVAGTVAAVRDNGAGGVGVAPNARIMPLKVLGDDGQGTVSDAIKAYDYAASHHVSIVNASLGGDDFSQAEHDAIERHEATTLFVVAAGNSGNNNDVPAEAEYPCAYSDLENVLCVGASRHDDTLASFSNFGETTVDVVAPGHWIVSTLPGNEYGPVSGTSMATPHVAGTAALLLSRDPGLTPSAITNAIVDHADDKPAFTDKSVSDGRANADATLRLIDGDADTVADGTDNCVGVANTDQADANSDGVGDACAASPTNPDSDALSGLSDKCPNEAGPSASGGCPGTDPGADGDYWPAALDLCPSQPGTVRGCPDRDRDGVRDAVDNCPTVPNPGQQNSDGRADGGDVCDRDADNDGRLDVSDACPRVFAITANGCPPPPNADGDAFIDVRDACPTERAFTANGCPVPALTALSGKVRKRGTRRWVTVRARTTRAATVRILVQRKKGRRWVKVKRRTLATSANRVTLKVSRLRRGRHRVVVALYSGAGAGTPATRYFTVR